MEKEVIEAKIKIEFQEGMTFNQDSTYEEALQFLLDALANGKYGDGKVKFEYGDGSKAGFAKE